MRTTLVSSAVVLLGVTLTMTTDSAFARGPGGGVQTLATPSIGGGSRGGSIGSSGLSFGSGGISFGGGGGRVTIGSGTGGISFGSRGRTQSLDRGHTEIPSNRGNHGSIQIPEIQIVPQVRIPNPTHTIQPSYRQPLYNQPTFQPPVTQPTPQVQPNDLPTNPAPEPIATDPLPNASGLVARQITEVEVQRAQEFFQQRLLDLAKVLEQRLPPAEFDPDQVTALMVQNSVPVKVQIQILDALAHGEYDMARQIWESLIPHVEIPFKPSRLRILLLRFYVVIQRGYVTYPVVQELIQQLPPEVLRPSTCCGADDLLVQIEEEVRINQAISSMPTQTTTDYGKPESFSKPRVNETPYAYTSTEMQTGLEKPNEFGKPSGFGETQPYNKPGQPVPVPSGPVNIVYHPKLPDRQVVVVNAQTVMVGTGGRGVFRMEHGYVAEALGHRLGQGSPVSDNQSELVRSGLVVVNPTHATVRFVFGRNEVVLEPGYQQALAGEGIISFDRGGGKGTARYTLEAGTYEFAVTEGGWDLHSKSYEVTVSNEGNFEPFHYIVQGEQVKLGPEEKKTHTSDYPILIRFDRGNDSATKQIRWENVGDTLQVAINPADNLWDLFVASEVEAKKSVMPTPDFVPAF